MAERNAQANETPHETAAEATVGGPLVPLYDQGGHVVHASEEDVRYWLDRGFTREPSDPGAIVEELPALFDSAKRAWREYADAVIDEGVIDTSIDGTAAVAHQSFTELSQAVGRLEQALTNRYQPMQGEPVAMVTAEGVATHIDPAQVEHYAALGYREGGAA